MDGTKARAGDAALGGKDAKFIGNRLEVDGILPAASKRVGDPLPKEQVRAAQLIARLRDEAAVDEALDLPAGTVKSWMNGEAFLEKVAEERRLVERYRTPYEDLGRILSPKQRDAARMRGLDGLSQIEVARALKVTDRTIRNWEREPAFAMYRDQLIKEEEKRRSTRRWAQSDRLDEAKEKALAALVKRVEEEGNLKAAIELLKLQE